MSTTPLILLHGFPLDHTLWTKQVEALSALTTVITPDLRGFGTDTRPVPDVITMEDHANDLVELMNERGIRRAVIAGLSMGGYVALAFLQRYPERVAGLVLANTRAGADTEAARAGRYETADRALAGGMDVIARGMVSKVLAVHTRERSPEIARMVERMMARQRPEAVAAAARGMAIRKNRLPELGTLSVPALVITGEEDELMPLPTSQEMVDAIPGATLTVLKRAGHLSNVDAPEAFNAAMHGFLSAIPRPS